MKTGNMSPIKKHDLDLTIRAQDDFYQHACGGWLKRNPIPKSEVTWGSFYVLRDENRKKIKTIFTELMGKKNIPKNSTSQLLRDFYKSGMDEKQIHKLGIDVLAGEFARIERTVTNTDIISLTAYFHTIGIDVLFGPMVSLDEKDSTQMALYLYQGSLGLPEREYYLENNQKFLSIRKKYLRFVQTMLTHSGVSPKNAQKAAKRIVEIERTLAEVSMSANERRDVVKLYNKMSIRTLTTLTPLVDWKGYLRNIGAIHTKSVVVGQVAYMKKLTKIVSGVSIEDWKNYYRFRLVIRYSGMLPKVVADESFNFYGKVLTGQKKQKPRWQRVLAVVDAAMTEAIGKEYIERYFSKSAEKTIAEMIHNLKQVYAKRMKSLDWMSETTKKKALKKLSTFESKIGAPKKPRSYREFRISPTAYLENVLMAEKNEFAREIAKLSKPIDRSEWFMGAHVVNAYYWPNQNEIVFPAGILQPPFFDAEGDTAMNYGSIGAVIGHELTHGFDDNGSLFDEKGNLKNWWTKNDRKAFMKKTKILVQQYNQFIAVDELHVNGELTLGENIADLGGVVLAYHAFQTYMKKHGRPKDIAGHTPEQRFFFGTVATERGAKRKEAARLHTVSDPHAPSYTRVNGPLVHIEEFHQAFGVTKSDKMYRAPKMRALIW